MSPKNSLLGTAPTAAPWRQDLTKSGHAIPPPMGLYNGPGESLALVPDWWPVPPHPDDALTHTEPWGAPDHNHVIVPT